MIVKGITTTVNFYALNTDGLPATGKASSITAFISINGGSVTAIADTISEIDLVNAPGWYRFNHQFDTAGNVFIIFSCANCNIAPWEEQVVDLSDIKDGLLNWSVAGNALTLNNGKTYAITRDANGNIISVTPR